MRGAEDRRAQTGMKRFGKMGNLLRRLSPALYFIFVFFLYFSLLSTPYFTDEQDVFYGGYSILKGHDIYASFLSAHMPFSYYFAVLPALFGARSVFQFRLGFYLMLSLCWEGIYLRNRKHAHPAVLIFLPLLYLSLLKTYGLGTTMISDHWQGIGLAIILLELIRYADSRKITLPCAGMIALGILLSFGTTFISAYALMCYFLAAVVMQTGAFRKIADPRERKAAGKKMLREDLRLAGICLTPFFLLAGWYAVSGNLQNAWEGIYEVTAKYYSRYLAGSLGSDPLRVVWETPVSYVRYLTAAVQNLSTDPAGSLVTLVQAAGLAGAAVIIGRKSPFTGIMTVLAAIYSGIRGFGEFHGMAYTALAAAALSLCIGWMLEKLFCKPFGKMHFPLRAWAAGGVLALALMADFMYWGAYNLLYPQPLAPQAARAEERVLDLLTDPGDVVHACDEPMYCQEIMNLELIPQENCGAISYPYFYEMWGQRQMEAIRKNPAVLLYDPEEQYEGHIFRIYAPDFDAYVRENYTHLPTGEDLWVANDFFPETERRLRDAGYGTFTVYTHRGEDFREVREVLPGETAVQRFTAEGTEMSALYFQAACFYGRKRPVLRVQAVEPETERVLGENVLGPEDIADSFYSRCPLSLKLVPGREYEIRLTVERMDGRGGLGIFRAADGRIPLGLEYMDEIGSRR